MESQQVFFRGSPGHHKDLLGRLDLGILGPVKWDPKWSTWRC